MFRDCTYKIITLYPISPPSDAYMSVNWIGISPGNGLSPVRRQAITWTSDGLLSIEPLGTNFSEIWMEIQKIYIHENAFKNVVCKMAAIVFRVQWAKG